MTSAEQREFQVMLYAGAATVFAAGFAAGCLWSPRRRAPAPARAPAAALAETQAPAPPLQSHALADGGGLAVESPSEPSESVSSTPRNLATPRGVASTKLVLLVRTDLQLGQNKVTLYSCQAALGWFKKMYLKHYAKLMVWEEGGAGKVVYVASTDAELAAVRARAKEANLTVMVVVDKGPPEGRAVLAIGPVPTASVAALVGGLAKM